MRYTISEIISSNSRDKNLWRMYNLNINTWKHSPWAIKHAREYKGICFTLLTPLTYSILYHVLWDQMGQINSTKVFVWSN